MSPFSSADLEDYVVGGHPSLRTTCTIKSLSVYLRSLVSAGRLVFSCCSHDYPGLLFLGFSKVNYSQCLTYVLLTSILFLSLSIAISLFLPITLDN